MITDPLLRTKGVKAVEALQTKQSAIPTIVHTGERGHFALVIMELKENQFISFEHGRDKGMLEYF